MQWTIQICTSILFLCSWSNDLCKEPAHIHTCIYPNTHTLTRHTLDKWAYSDCPVTLPKSPPRENKGPGFLKDCTEEGAAAWSLAGREQAQPLTTVSPSAVTSLLWAYFFIYKDVPFCLPPQQLTLETKPAWNPKCSLFPDSTQSNQLRGETVDIFFYSDLSCPVW